MKFSIKDFFSKCDQIRSFLRIWSHLLKKSLMENFIFCEVFHIARKKLNTKIFIWAESVIINNNNTSFQKGNWGQNITPTFLHIFVNIMEKKPSTKFYVVSDYFWRSCKVTKFWMIRRCLYVIDVIDANDDADDFHSIKSVLLNTLFDFSCIIMFSISKNVRKMSEKMSWDKNVLKPFHPWSFGLFLFWNLWKTSSIKTGW